MTAKWGICVVLVALLALSTGCRSSQPNLKPETTAEKLVDPPANTRLSSDYPKQAFSPVTDPTKNGIEAAKGVGGMPTRGGMAGSGTGGLR